MQYGCGWSAPNGWRNFDASPTLRFERIPLVGRLYTKNSSRFPQNVEYGDITKGLPIPDESCRAVYCSHVLEHLSLVDLRVALLHTHRILQAGGVFRLVVPDLYIYAEKYLSDRSSGAALTFMRNTGLGSEKRERGFLSFLNNLLSNSKHLWMWDFQAMQAELRRAGFFNIRRASYGDSSDPKFSGVEQIDRWTDCLGVECRR